MEQNPTLIEIENLLQSIAATALGLDKDTGVRVSWPTEGAPAWGIDEDIVFLRATEQERDNNKQRDKVIISNMIGLTEDPDNLIEQMSYTRSISVYWILYGPNSYDNAQNLKDKLFDDFETTLALESLQLFIVPNINAVKRVPEPFEGQWWPRVDMEIFFNQGVTKEKLMPITKCAELTVYEANDNEIIDITIQQD